MNTQEAEEISVTLTQDIQRYMDMEPRTAYDAIAAEWPEQIAVLLVEFLFKTLCGSCDGILDFVVIEPETGQPFITTLCDCDNEQTTGDA